MGFSIFGYLSWAWKEVLNISLACITWWAPGESGSGGNASHLTHPVLTRLRGAKADPKTANNADHIILSKCTQVLKTHIGRLHIYELCKNEAVLVAL